MLRHNRLALTCLTALLAAAAACDGHVPTDSDPIRRDLYWLQTDRVSYELTPVSGAYQTVIGATFRNLRPSASFVEGCGDAHPPTLEVWYGGQWTEAYAPTVVRCYTDPLVIGAGATVRVDLTVMLSTPEELARLHLDRYPPPAYRLNWRVLGDKPAPTNTSQAALLPEESRVSNEFSIHLQ